MCERLFFGIKELNSVVHKKLDELQGEHVDDRRFVPYQDEAIVVVGSGPVGMHFVGELLRRGTDTAIVVYGGEPVQPYNRVKLSDYLAGDMYRDALEIKEEVDIGNAQVEYRYNCAVEWIDRKARTVMDATGGVQHYSKLILATGSTPFVPMMENSELKGVYTFRTLGEADELLSRKMRTRHTVVLGGGLLGLETARAMQKYNTRITVVEHNHWLMMQQLDEKAGEYLKDFIEQTGITVMLGESIDAVQGDGRVESVKLRSGIEIACDTLIVAAGIRPNVSLAKESGIICHKGIRIDDSLQTSDEHIFAIGECAEHDEVVYGLVKPGLDQASVLAEMLSGGRAQYLGSSSATQLKVMSQAVFSAGRTGVFEDSGSTVREYVYSDKKEGIYRKVRIFGNRLVGVIALGPWHESALINEAIQEKISVWTWHLMRFKSTGNLWGDKENHDISDWPASAIVCNCTSVSRGRLSIAINGGCDNVDCLTAMTRAGSVCGSCKPLLAEMIGADASLDPVRGWRSLLAMSALAISLAALFIFIWRIPYADSVQNSFQWDILWRDSFYKQLSGFTILGLFGIGLTVSLRKRVKAITVGDYSLWRMGHIVLGVGALIALVAHTGFRLGDELNLLLMLDFLLIAIAGANASTVVANEHTMVPAQAKRQRRRWNNLHLYLFWPLPVLLGFHIFKTYYF